MNLIDENQDSPEVVAIFLKSLTNKNLLRVAKSSSQGSFKFLAFHASLFGHLALRFGPELKDDSKDAIPSLIKTVRRIVEQMINLFFGEAHDTIRNACTLSFKEILDNCFVDKMYGKEVLKQAKDIIYAPLFEELKPKKFTPGKDAAIASLTTRQSACYVIRRLNEMHMNP